MKSLLSTYRDVLHGGAKWSAETNEASAWLRSLPDNSIDLMICSPPYEDARSYGIDYRLAGEAYVAWMITIVQAAAPKVKGPICIVIEGRTDDFAYSGSPFLLFADLHRLGFTLRKPGVYHRHGIPGSGGNDWFRNDWEPVLFVTRPGKLPFSDQTACGHPPRWAPGGAMSHRLSNGAKVNQWGKNGGQTTRDRHGKKKTKTKPKPSHKVMTKAEVITRRNEAGERDAGEYVPPALANPGNTVQELYTADEVAALVAWSSDVSHCKVGGNQMGSKLAHKSEAPFPAVLVERYVKTFTRPGDVVADCFLGSGTVCDVSVKLNRRFIGCDLRPCQVENTHRRMRGVTPTFLGME